MTLADFGLTVDDTVRFRPFGENSRWREAKVLGIDSTDGSIEIADHDGRVRCKRAETLELKTKGPRGGVHWVPIPAE